MRQAAHVCQKSNVASIKSKEKEARIFLSKTFLLNPAKSSVYTVSLLSFGNTKGRIQNTSIINLFNFFVLKIVFQNM